MARARKKTQPAMHYEISVWDFQGDVIKKLWDASEADLEQVREEYEPEYSVVIDREWEEAA